MDSLEPTPAKKRCFIKNEKKMQLIECVREFRLPQQFPSTLKQAVKQGIINPTESSPSILTMSENVTVLSGAESNRQIPINKLQKLRILSSKGKDLGEFNVELRTDNSLKGQAIMITKMSALKPVKKPVTVTLSPISRRIFPRILKQGTARIPKYNLINIKSFNKNDSEANKINALQHCTILPIKKMIGNQDIKARGKEIQVFNSDINVEDLVSTRKTNSKQSMYQTIDSNNQKHIMCNRISNINSHVKISEIKVIEDSETSLVAKVLPYKEIIEPLFPIVNLKHTINSSNSNNAHRSEGYSKVSKRKYITNVKKI